MSGVSGMSGAIGVLVAIALAAAPAGAVDVDDLTLTTEEPGPDGRAPGARAPSQLELAGYAAAGAMTLAGALALLSSAVIFTTPSDDPAARQVGVGLLAIGATSVFVGAPLVAGATYVLAEHEQPARRDAQEGE